MTAQARPIRSVLYLPASNARALEKARSLPVDALILDLEDAVTPDQKPEARTRLSQTLTRGGFGPRLTIVRINGLNTPWGADDVAAVAGMACDAVLLPKVETPAQLDAVADRVGDKSIWAMMETPRGILNAAAIAAHPRLAGLVMGTNDLAKELRTGLGADRMPLVTALGLCLLAARASGLAIVDGVYNAFRDDAGLEAECIQGRDMGFDGKTLIHPAQITTANRVFSPSQDDIAQARRQIEAFDEAKASGRGVAVVEGRIVENLHVETARRILDTARAIEQREV